MLIPSLEIVSNLQKIHVHGTSVVENDVHPWTVSLASFIVNHSSILKKIHEPWGKLECIRDLSSLWLFQANADTIIYES